MDEIPKVSPIEEYLIIWQQLWTEARHKQTIYDKLDNIWKSMTLEEKQKVNQILHSNTSL